MPALPTSLPVHSNAGIPEHWSSLIGIVTAIVGNILISFALNTQRYAHIRIDREYKDRKDPEAKSARKQLPKQFRKYGAIVQQEEAAEERQRINEQADVPPELNGYHSDDDRPKQNGKTHSTDDEAHSDEDEGAGHDSVKRQSYLKSPYWWLGIALMTVGETGNFLAYGFAPASIVSPLGVVGLISNCLIAPLMLKERFRQRDFWGVLVAIGGAVTVVLSAKTDEKKLGPHGLWADIKRWEFLAYVLITFAFIVALMIASPKYGGRTIMVDLGLVGLFGGYTALSTKGVASLLSTSLYRAFEYPLFYVLILTLAGSAIMQIRYLNRALQNFPSTQVIPVQFVLFTLSVIIGSAVLYRDFERTDVDHVLKFVFGCLLTFGGVYLITSGRKPEDEEEEDDGAQDHDVERIHLLDEESVDNEPTPIKQEPDLKLNTAIDFPQTPPQLSHASSTVPSLAITPAEFTDDLNKNPWISSTDHLARTQTNTTDRPETPRDQTIPTASSSQTPFFTPSTTLKPQDRLSRAISSPSQPETPTRRAQSPPKADLQEPTSKRNSITRLFPGPIWQPLSSSLSAVVADRILRGEGTPTSPSSIRSSLRRHRSNRESGRLRAARSGPGASENDLESALPAAFASDSSIAIPKASNSRNRTQGASLPDDAEESPLLRRSGTANGANSGTIGKTKGRLRSMSETLTNMMTTRRRDADDNSEAI